MSEEQKNQGGRPSKFTPELHARLCVAVRRVGFAGVAAELHGIHRDTLARWLHKGRAGDPEFADFAADFDCAKAEWSQEQLGKLEQQPAWLLERADRQFRPQVDTNTKHSGEVGVTLDLSNLSTAELKRQMRDALNDGGDDG